MAVALQQDRVLYRPGGVLRFDAAGHTHEDHRDRASTLAVRVGYSGHDHYDSVVPAAGGAPSSRKRHREAEDTTKDESRPLQQAKMEPRAVVVKVFQQKRLATRDNELEVLPVSWRRIPILLSSSTAITWKRGLLAGDSGGSSGIAGQRRCSCLCVRLSALADCSRVCSSASSEIVVMGADTTARPATVSRRVQA